MLITLRNSRLLRLNLSICIICKLKGNGPQIYADFVTLITADFLVLLSAFISVTKSAQISDLFPLFLTDHAP